jgi:hypothetical protein
MTTTDIDLDEFHPLRQKKKAQDMMVERKQAKIRFVISTPQGVMPCEWIDPFMGFFHKIGETGMIAINDLPEGSLIIGQHFVEPDANESPCLFCNSMGNRCPDDPMCDVYTAFKEKARK